MQKVLLTTYRTLYKMGSHVDRSTGMRSVLSCAPTRVYNHRKGEWTPINVAKLSSWAETRIFLDSLIRRLNGGRQFYIPPTTEADRAQAEKLMKDLAEKTAAVAAAASPLEGAESAKGNGTASPGPTPAVSGSSHGASSPQIPPQVAPYTPLRNCLRIFFENTSFSIANLNNAFAAVKELSYVCEITKKHQPLVVKLPEALRSRPHPTLERVCEVDPIHHVRLIKGLTEEVMESLRTPRQPQDHCREAEALPAEAAGEGAGTAGNAFDDAEGDRPPSTEERGEEDEEEEGAAVRAEGSSDAAAAAQEANNTMPKHVQLLLAHPQLSGFFRHSVLLVVRNAGNESAAFILNKPLENDEGLRMPVSATIRLNRVHPVFSKFLRSHTIMVGGPVMIGGAFDESVFLLHSIPGIPTALPLGNGLWLDGDLDELMEKLQSGAASPSQIVVMCGFSGWGVRQLRGEVKAGTWVVVSGDAEDKAVPAFVMELAHLSGAHAGPAGDVVLEEARDRSGKKDDERETPSSAAGQEDAADPARLSVRISASHRSTISWVWAYGALEEPLASLATNQKPESVAEFSD